MTERESLIQLIDTPNKADKIRNGGKITSEYPSEILADWLIQNGVIVPPCKIGDIIYYPSNGEVWQREAIAYGADYSGNVVVDDSYNGWDFDSFGKDVFVTKEEAEKALKESEK